MKLPAAAALLAALAGSVLTGELPKGQLIEKVVCTEDPQQSYAAYLPSNYGPARRWPVIYCFDPGARGRVPVERFQAGAEKYGYVVVGSNNSRNGPWAPTAQAINAMARDTAARFAIDERRVCTAGFSGGARVASRVGLAGAAAGVIACGGGFPFGVRPKTLPFVLFATAGTDDFNYIEMRQLDSELETAGAPHRLVVFDGGHDWPPAAVATQAIEWLELQGMRKGTRPKDDALIQDLLRARLSTLETLPAAEAYLESKSIAADFKALADVAAVEKRAAELGGSREVRDWVKTERAQETRQLEATAALIESATKDDFGELRARVKGLKKSAEAKADSPERRLARRVLNGAFIQGYEAGRDLLERKEYRRAAAMFEMTTVLNPGRGQSFYDLARARALAGDRKQALSALKQAAALGFSVSGAAADPAFKSLRADAAFREVTGE